MGLAKDMEAAPAGDIGNHVLPEVIIILTGVIALVAVGIRLVARHLMRRLGIPDILLAISLAFYGAHHYNAYQAAIYPGLGVHQWQYNPDLAATSKYSFKNGSVFFGVQIVFLKIAVLLDWRRIFAPPGGGRNYLWWILQILIWANAVFYFIGTIIEALQCPPTQKNCPINASHYNLASGIINVISDLTILIAPHWVIWSLKLSAARKIGVSILFAIGILATASAVARVIYVAAAYRTGDILYYVVSINLWAIAEQTFGYLVIGIPALPKVFQSIPFMKQFLSTGKKTSTPSGYPPVNTPRKTWPSNRKSKDPWDIGDGDTHVLMTVNAKAGGSKESGFQIPEETHSRV
ncbi:hypothetical protein GGR57DRAFT_503845 [Xylariaceae sp. FL1272]|nr:hypothetical protein GGR57DRAFT_503845 [Xylariaceae sp. FL1272]